MHLHCTTDLRYLIQNNDNALLFFIPAPTQPPLQMSLGSARALGGRKPSQNSPVSTWQSEDLKTDALDPSLTWEAAQVDMALNFGDDLPAKLQHIYDLRVSSLTWLHFLTFAFGSWRLLTVTLQ